METNHQACSDYPTASQNQLLRSMDEKNQEHIAPLLTIWRFGAVENQNRYRSPKQSPAGSTPTGLSVSGAALRRA
ncbi:hypothetical protein [Variovorax sp. OK202]|uniref:hypothetical protein n=1 Tax=Variovorax sp. OK202 TaxID=1884311 RepID=UPI0011605964|nr:hypothetical protein [Variovorax sp. OK202]